MKLISKIYKGAHHGFIKVQERQYFEYTGNMKNCKPGYVDEDGYWFYNNKPWKNMTELETVNAIFKECGGQGVTVWGTKEQQKQAIADTVNFFKKHLKQHQSPLCGSSVSHDRRFMIKHMPKLANFFHYRHIDVSSFKEVIKRWHPKAEEFKKTSSHRALDDIKESVNELKFYRDNFFK